MLEQIYDERIKSGHISDDDAQRRTVVLLDGLLNELNQATGILQKFRRKKPPKGVYIWGGVGRGKSMLMDMFAGAARQQNIKVKRFHFHDFMQAVHDKIHDPKINKYDEPARHVAAAIAQDAKLICFDEMEVRDIADAMILARVVEGFLDSGGVLVVTSNRKPCDLYENGLHRERFIPFIKTIEDKMTIHEMVSPTDYRQEIIATMTAWFSPNDGAAAKKLDEIFVKLAQNAPIETVRVAVAGRCITFDNVAASIARVGFNDLCAIPLAARDYLALADRYNGIIIDDIPALGDDHRNEARRFMWLVDAFYDRGRFLIASAEKMPDEIYQGNDWNKEFPRTASRLTEMTKL